MKKILFFILTFVALGAFAQNWAWTPQTSPVSKQLRDVFFTNELQGWAVGDSGTVIMTNDGGQNWTHQSSGTNINLGSVYFADSLNGYVLSSFFSTSNIALKTTDGGNSWATMTVGTNIIKYTDLSFTSVNNGIIVTQDKIYTTVDGGASWQEEYYVTTVAGGLLNTSVSSFNDSISIVGGTRYTSSSNATLVPEIFDRRPWNAPLIWGTSGVSSFDNTDKIKCLEVAGPTRAFAGGEKGKIYKMELTLPNYNGPWTLNLDLSPTVTQTIRSISFPTNNLGMFNTFDNGSTSALIYHTNNGGNNWTTSPDSIQDLYGARLHAPTPNHAWIVGNGGKIYHGVPSSNGINEKGIANFVKAYPNPTTGYLSLEFKDSRNEEKYVEIVDITGRTVMSMLIQPANNNYELNLNNLKAGIYFINFQGKRNMPLKIIKQ